MSTSRLVERLPIQLSLADEVVSVRVRESKRRRSIRIGIGPDRPLEVIVPAGTSDRSVRRALEQNRGWISQKLRSTRAVANRPSQLGLDRPGVVHLNGDVVPVARRSGRAIARLDGERLLVGGSDADAAAAIRRWYRREAGARIADRARVHESAIGVHATTISIRDPRSRWGSCSGRGTLSFSWRLLLAPAEVLDYVVVHELCHLVQPNHSRAFWDVVETHFPARRQATAWLHQHGHELHRYDPCTAVA